jgi:serine protease Do
MRRTILGFLTASAVVAVIAACTGGDHAQATGPAPQVQAPLYQAATAAGPEAQIPVQASLAPLIERLKPSVVNISTTTVTKSPHAFEQRGPQADPFERFFGRPMPDMPREFRGQGLGSGFVISKEGYILTNNHVVKDATDIRVRLHDKEYTAKIVGRDPLTDVALIKLNNPPKDLPVAVLGDSEALRQGDFVLALGSPFNLRDTATLGIVSAKHRGGVNPGGGGTYDDFIQTDAAINPGNSGGPLFNLRGEVVGINTAIVSPQIGSGIGFAVPIDIAKSLLPQLQAKGKVVRGYLGVSISDLTPDLVQAFGFKEGTRGALVQQVVPGTPAAEAGVKPGDVVVSLDGKAVESSGALTRGVALVPPGQKVTLGLLRDGKETSLSFQVAKRPDEEELAQGGSDEAGDEDGGQSPKLGVRVQGLTPQLAKEQGIEADAGLLVVGVVDGGPAERAGLRRGDVILEANRTAVARPEQLSAALKGMKDGQMLLLRVKRGDASLFLAVPVGGRQ